MSYDRYEGKIISNTDTLQPRDIETLFIIYAFTIPIRDIGIVRAIRTCT